MLNYHWALEEGKEISKTVSKDFIMKKILD
jgi:hypothetical protein